MTMKFVVPLLLSFVLLSCSKETQTDSLSNPYIVSHTTGMVSSRSDVIIRLSLPLRASSSDVAELLDFSPNAEGVTEWVDDQTIRFRPSAPFEADQTYSIRFALKRLLPDVEDVANLDFEIRTLKQSVEVSVEGLSSPEFKTDSYVLTGTVRTADIADFDRIERMVDARLVGSQTDITWTHDTANRSSEFIVYGINRTDATQKLILVWDANLIGVSETGKQEIDIPARGTFEISDMRLVSSPQVYVEVRFSELIDSGQPLDGLIQIQGESQPTVVKDGSLIKIYPRNRIDGSRQVVVSPGIRNRKGIALKTGLSRDILFSAIHPEVRFVTDGVIVPGTGIVQIPIETANIRAVDIQVSRVFQNNMPQHLQVNSLKNDWQFERVGRPVYSGTISLEAIAPIEEGRWNRYLLDLSAQVRLDPGALYRVQIGFREIHSLYECAARPISTGSVTYADASLEKTYWNRFNEGWWYPEGYEWNQNRNPCHVSYFNSNRQISRNLLSSDLGLIAKHTLDGTMIVSVAHLQNTNPIPGVSIKVLDLQNQVIISGTTGNDGSVRFNEVQNPWLVIAQQDNQFGYLKVDNGSSRPLSAFDVSGSVVRGGLKGFMYGERGVWRPGDSLHIALMLDDASKTLPANHPVVMELRNPMGSVVSQRVLTQSVRGMYRFSDATSMDAPTGLWTLTARVGDQRFTHNVRIETIKPNRLRIKPELKTDRNIISGSLAAEWLTGATARGLKADINMRLTDYREPFEGFPNFVFWNMNRSMRSEPIEVYSGTLSESGVASIRYPIEELNQASGRLRGAMTIRVFEASGDFSTDQMSVIVAPYTAFAGLHVPETSPGQPLLTGRAHSVEVVSVDGNGSPLANRTLDVNVYKLRWRWWWDSEAADDGAYLARQQTEPVFKQTVRTDASGKGSFPLTISDANWGRYLIEVKETGSSHVVSNVAWFDGPGWAGRSTDDGSGAPIRMNLSVEKPTYTSGETVSIRFPGAENGRALITIENSKGIREEWVATTAGLQTYSFKSEPGHAPNVYVSVTLIQPYASTSNSHPIRMYGVVPVLVTNPATVLRPVIEMAEVLEPETTTRIRVKEANGKPMVYTIAMVDEGLLDITRFQTPDPHKHFYAKEALGTRTWDVYEFVSGASSGRINRVITIGGDGELRPREESVIRFKPMVRYLGPFFLSSGQTASHSIDIPSYIGSVRTMVVAGYEGAYGSSQKATPVRKPLMVLGTLPRVLGPQEELRLPVTVFAMESSVKQVDVKVTVTGPLNLPSGDNLKLSFTEIGNETAYLPLKVGAGLGAAKVRITATSGSLTSVHEIDIEVRQPLSRQTIMQRHIVEAGQNWTPTWNWPGMNGTNIAWVELSAFPSMNLESRLNDLMGYPHGCIEQTVSAVFPQIYLDKLMTLPKERQSEIIANVSAAMSRLALFTVPGGGLSYWPGSDQVQEWSTVYATHFIIEAGLRGYAVPASLRQSVLPYIQRKASQWDLRQTQNTLIQSYRLYVLALAGSPDVASMNRLRTASNLTMVARWQLAAAYQMAGMPAAATELLTRATTTVSTYRELSGTFGSTTRDQAIILDALVRMNRRDEAQSLLQNLAGALSAESWMSTQEVAFSLIAMSNFIGNAPVNTQLKGRVRSNGGSWVNLDTDTRILRIPIPENAVSTSNLEVQNQSGAPLFAQVVASGMPAIAPDTDIQQGLRQVVKFRTPKGETISVDRIQQGTDVVVEVVITHPGTTGTYRELALEMIFPSGWEILNPRMMDPALGTPTSAFAYQDFRDDRVYTYFDLEPGQSRVYRILVNTSYVGRFFMPGIKTSAMYDASIQATSVGRWVEVVATP